MASAMKGLQSKQEVIVVPGSTHISTDHRMLLTDLMYRGGFISIVVSTVVVVVRVDIFIL
jgi:hypothetical protein